MKKSQLAFLAAGIILLRQPARAHVADGRAIETALQTASSLTGEEVAVSRAAGAAAIPTPHGAAVPYEEEVSDSYQCNSSQSDIALNLTVGSN